MATLIQTMQGALDSKDPLLAVEIRRIIVKEVLQAHVLDFLYNHAVYRRLNFYGGTCLHVVYDLNRLSEDLDFDNHAKLDLDNLQADLLVHFEKTLGYAETSAKQQEDGGGILRITLKFPLLYDLGLSPHKSEALHLKVEISQHDQVSIVQHTPVLVYGRSLVATHFSLETMMAGKMLACLERNFERGRDGVTIKGRDFYDLWWFMQKRIWPLEEKLAQDGENPYTVQSAILALQEKIQHIPKRTLAIDLLPMFENRNFIETWLDAFHDNFSSLMKMYLVD